IVRGELEEKAIALHRPRLAADDPCIGFDLDDARLEFLDRPGLDRVPVPVERPDGCHDDHRQDGTAAHGRASAELKPAALGPAALTAESARAAASSAPRRRAWS